MEHAYSRRRGAYYKNCESFLMAHVVDIVDRIEEMFSETPDKRKKKEYQDWKNTINKLIEEVNKASKMKMYTVVK